MKLRLMPANLDGKVKTSARSCSLRMPIMRLSGKLDCFDRYG